MPMKKSGAAMLANNSVHLRSLRCRPGTMNAHIWYSQMGADSTIPNTSAILIWKVNGSATPVIVSCGSRPFARATPLTPVSHGFFSRLSSGVYQIQPTMVPTVMASTLFTKRLRSSAMCSPRVIRPSAFFGRLRVRSRPKLRATGRTAGGSVALRRRRAVARVVPVHLRVRLLGLRLGLRLSLLLDLLLHRRVAGLVGQLGRLVLLGDLVVPCLLGLAEGANQPGQLRGAEEQHHDH